MANPVSLVPKIEQVYKSKAANPLLGTPTKYATVTTGAFGKSGDYPNCFLNANSTKMFFPVMFKNGAQTPYDTDLEWGELDKTVMTALLITKAITAKNDGLTTGIFILNITQNKFMNAADAVVGDELVHLVLVECGLLGPADIAGNLASSGATVEIVLPDEDIIEYEAALAYNFAAKGCVDADLYDDVTHETKSAIQILDESNVEFDELIHIYPIKDRSMTVVITTDDTDPTGGFGISAIEANNGDVDPADPIPIGETGVEVKPFDQLMACCGGLIGFILLIVAAVCMTIEKAKEKGGVSNRFGFAQIIFYGLAVILALMAMSYGNMWMFTGVVGIVILQKLVAGNDFAVWPTLDRRI